MKYMDEQLYDLLGIIPEDQVFTEDDINIDEGIEIEFIEKEKNESKD